MTWVLLIGAVWLTVAALVGVLIGRSIRLADRKNEDAAAAEAAAPNFVVDPAPLALPQPAAPDNVLPSVPTARTSSAPALAEPPREPGPF
jgi:hypothetical protein